MSATMDTLTTGLAFISLAQWREMIWSDPRQSIYGVILPSRIPGVRARLTNDAVDDWDGLWTGELEDDERAIAPLLVTLKPDSPFTDWLLSEAANEFGPWGAIVQSPQRFLGMRKHARALCRAQLPNGQAIRIDWMDPEVVESLLPIAVSDQLQSVFAGFDAMFTVRPRQWTRWTFLQGSLTRETRSLK